MLNVKGDAPAHVQSAIDNVIPSSGNDQPDQNIVIYQSSNEAPSHSERTPSAPPMTQGQGDADVLRRGIQAQPQRQPAKSLTNASEDRDVPSMTEKLEEIMIWSIFISTGATGRIFSFS